MFSYDLLYSLSRHFDRIAVCTSSQFRELFEIFPVPRTTVIAYAPESWPHWDPETIHEIEDFRADAGLLLPNSIGAALALRWAGVSKLYGYDTERRDFLLAGALKPPGYRIHQTDYFLRLLNLFGISETLYPAPAAAQRERTVVIHPGASKKERAWHLERFLEIAKGLQERGVNVQFVSGEKIHAGDFPVLVRPSLWEFTELLRKSSLFIGNDSGPLHLAQQCGTPVVGIYGPGDPKVTGPRPISLARVVYHSFPCSPCRQRYFRECDPSENGKPFCIERITVNEVLRICAQM